MKIELNNQDDLKNKNPFKVPDGYFEGLSSQIMSQIADKPVQEARKITLMDRMRPWVYMAAMFAGLGLFFKVFIGTGGVDERSTVDPLLVQSQNPITSIIYETDFAEEEDYWEYIESQYADYLLADEFEYFE